MRNISKNIWKNIYENIWEEILARIIRYSKIFVENIWKKYIRERIYGKNIWENFLESWNILKIYILDKHLVDDLVYEQFYIIPNTATR